MTNSGMRTSPQDSLTYGHNPWKKWMPCLCCKRLCPFEFCSAECASVGEKR